MKKLLVTTSMLLLVILLQAQDLKKGVWGLSMSIGNSAIIQHPLTGAAGYEGLTSYETGLYYLLPVTKSFSFESGVIVHTNKIEITPAFYPGIDQTPKYTTLTMAYIPINGKLMLSRHFFINGGLLLNVDLSNKSRVDQQTGIGSDLGLGIEIPVFKSHKIEINPFLNFHGMCKFGSERYPQRLWSDGIRLILH